PDKGVHDLKLSFTVRAVPTGDHLDLKFEVPKLPKNSMTLEWAQAIQSLHCLRGWGEEKSTLDGSQAVKSWQSQLGYENTVHLRWPTATPGAPFAKASEVQEM